MALSPRHIGIHLGCSCQVAEIDLQRDKIVRIKRGVSKQAFNSDVIALIIGQGANWFVEGMQLYIWIVLGKYLRKRLESRKQLLGGWLNIQRHRLASCMSRLRFGRR